MFAVFDHKMQSVEYVGFGGAAVEVEEQQAQLRIDLLDFFLDAFGNDVIGDAAERLQADHVLYAAFGQVANLAG